jgi:hypothetical protein
VELKRTTGALRDGALHDGAPRPADVAGAPKAISRTVPGGH